MRRALIAPALAVILAVAGCGTDQDPSIDPGPDVPATTSVTLGACPDGGPDASTPAAGCLDESGRVIKG